ncbi:hypothetical protein [Microbulbifer marinus]|uniref:hypothetical protein n=1 Tax=Microbulbifer marinus TaxID=658218 RepID=UPI0011153C00|nr:hypothetical protein [Microbulbifer marinus]
MNSEILPLESDVRQKMTLNGELRNPFVAKFRNETRLSQKASKHVAVVNAGRSLGVKRNDQAKSTFRVFFRAAYSES